MIDMPEKDDSAKLESKPLDLYGAMAWTVLAVLMVFLLPDGSFIRVLVSIPLLLIIPGYSFVSILWPAKSSTEDNWTNMDITNRLVLSLGLSLVLVALIGAFLHFASLGITLASFIAALSSFIFIASFIAMFRRSSLPEENRFSINICPRDYLANIDKPVALVIAILLISSGLVVGYLLVTPAENQYYSSLYILDSNETVVDYPNNLTVNEPGTLIVGVNCNEHILTNYTIITYVNNASTSEELNDWNGTISLSDESTFNRSISLEHDQLFEDEFTFQFQTAGEYQITMALLIEDEPTDYIVHLRVTVNE